MGRSIVRFAVIGVALLLVLAGCSTLRNLQLWQPPKARVVGVAVTALSFQGAEITADIEITNPNAIGIDLAGLDYSLSIEGYQLVSGEIDRDISIAARGVSTVGIPVALTFADVSDTVTAVGDKDEVAYEIATELRFDIPILGRVAIPLSAVGTLPVVRLPNVKVARLTVDSITLLKATAVLRLTVDNPNTFGFRVQSFDYRFEVQERPWLDGALSRDLNVQPKGSVTVDLPFSIGFVDVGLAVRDLLLGNSDVNYRFSSELVVAPDIDFMQPATIPIVFNGSVPVAR